MVLLSIFKSFQNDDRDLLVTHNHALHTHVALVLDYNTSMDTVKSNLFNKSKASYF